MTHNHTHSTGHDYEPWRALPDGFADYLALEARLSSSVVDAAIEHGAAALGIAPSEVLDLGSGAGGATIALAQRFPAARIHGLDVSPELLDRLATAATAANVQDQVVRHQADLDGAWTGQLPSRVDLAWAALSLHHVREPGWVLSQVLETLRPGGVLVLTELNGCERFGAEDLDSLSEELKMQLERAGRGHRHAAHDWSALLTAAGFTSLERHDEELIVRADTADARDYLTKQLRGYPHQLGADGHELDVALAALQTGTSTLSFRSGRVIWVAKRPAPETSDTAA